MNKNNNISVLIKVFFNDISNIVFVEKRTRKRLFIEVSWLEFHKYGITQIPRKEYIKKGKLKNIFLLHSIVYFDSVLRWKDEQRAAIAFDVQQTGPNPCEYK